MLIRKTQLIKETVFAEAGEPSPVAIRRVAALAVIGNPFAGRYDRHGVAAQSARRQGTRL